jgi:UTP--glucose-1-phosphate uridylyltransferase
MKPIRKAVFPVAGLGTRYLPTTKAMPKEMLPIVDKPLIQYAVEEALNAGITELIFVTGRNKRAIEDNFDRARELEVELGAKGKQALLDSIRSILPEHMHCIYTRQAQPLGLGQAILCAAPIVGNESFAVLLADDLLDADTAVTRQLVDAAHQHDGSVPAIQEIDPRHSRKYGIVACVSVDARNTRVEHIVEKSEQQDVPSNQAVVGRYVLEPEIFDLRSQTRLGVGQKIHLTDAISALLRHRPVFAHRYVGGGYDCGSKEGFFRATVALGKKYHGFNLE